MQKMEENNMTTKILNLTQHVATPEQSKAGVFEPSAEDKIMIQKILTFEEIPSIGDMKSRAYELSQIVSKIYNDIDIVEEYNHFDWVETERTAMIGGAPYFMSVLEEGLKHEGVKPVYAFSKRESVDQIQPDESIRKVAVFRHCGFVEV